MRKLALYCLIMIYFYTACTKSPARIENQVSIISIAPSSGLAGTRVVIKGAHFAVSPSDNIVRFNNDSAIVISSAPDSLVAVAPAKGSTGPVTVSVAGAIATGPVFTYIKDSFDVYVSAPASGVIYWKNGTAIFLESTQGNTGGAYGIAVSDTDVYVGGYTYWPPYPFFRAGYWKNGKKTMLSSPDYGGEIRALVLSGKDLYAAGSESDMPVYWKNGVKYSLPIFGPGYARLNALAVNGNDVYAAGFEAGPDNEQRLVYWKNGIETLLGRNGVVAGGATSIAVSGNDVYVCGIDSGQAVYWKNGVRVVLEKYEVTAEPAATAIAVHGNSVYVVGKLGWQAVYWKDGKRIALPSKGFLAGASAITFYESDVYIGGFDGGGIVYWKNGVEVQLCCSNNFGTASGIAVVKKF